MIHHSWYTWLNNMIIYLQMLTDKETVKFLDDFGEVKTLKELQAVCIT